MHHLYALGNLRRFLSRTPNLCAAFLAGVLKICELSLALGRCDDVVCLGGVWCLTASLGRARDGYKFKPNCTLLCFIFLPWWMKHFVYLCIMWNGAKNICISEIPTLTSRNKGRIQTKNREVSKVTCNFNGTKLARNREVAQIRVSKWTKMFTKIRSLTLK